LYPVDEIEASVGLFRIEEYSPADVIGLRDDRNAPLNGLKDIESNVMLAAGHRSLVRME
jgi:hypothetical protein